MKFSKSVCLFLLLIVFANRLFSQSLLKQVLPPSPNAASLGKFADFPTNLYNGLPQIDIPIYTVSQWGMNVPVSLSYHAGGIQVAEVPSWVGSGWTLNAGGVITRSVRGIPDDASGGFIVNPSQHLPECTGTLGPGNAAYEFFEATTRGVNDTESDMYYFNFCGKSGKFVFDQNGNVHTVPYQKINIKRNPTTSSPTGLHDWEIITEDGTIFYFNEKEVQQVVTNSYGDAIGASAISYTSSWYLKEIRSPRTNQKITFEYGSDNYEYDMPASQTKYELNPAGALPCINHNGSYTINKTFIYDARRVSKIIFPDGNIEFVAGKYRHDLRGARVLDKIIIRNNAGVIKSYNLFYNYFSAVSMTEFPALGDADANTVANTSLRLSLKGIQEFSLNNVVGQSYEFTYENNVWLPDRVTSKAVDNWGYFNGRITNTTLIPTYKNFSGALVFGAFRETVEPYAKAGVLKKIKYPTGGHTSFDYESNEVSSSVYGDEVQEISKMAAGGLCHVTPGQVFEIPGPTTFQLSFTGTKWPVTAWSNCTNQPFNPSQPWTYVYFNVFEVTNPGNPVYMDILGNNSVGPITIGYASANYNQTVSLPKGKYQIQARFGSPTGPILQTGLNVDGMYTLELKGQIIIKNENKKVGGLRLREMTAYDPAANKSTTKVYKYNIGGVTTSSGKINFVPTYKYDYSEIQVCDDGHTDVIRSAQYAVYSSSSYAPLTGMQGGNVGYDSVTVYYGSDANGNIGLNGKTEHFFNTRADFSFRPSTVTLNAPQNVCYNPGRIGQTSLYPFAEPVSADWARGLPQKEINYKNVNGAFVKVDETINTYKDDFLGAWDSYNPAYDVLGAKVDWAVRVTQPTAYGLPALTIQYYYVPSRYVKLMKTEKRSYDNDGIGYVGTISEYQYNNATSDLQKKVETLRDSKGSIIKKEYKYPGDYPSVPVYAGMKAGNILNAVVDETTYRDNAVSKIVKNSYAQVNNLFLPDNTEVIIENKLPTSKYYFSKYDSYGNLLEQQKSDDVINAYIYDYAGAYLIAGAVNARHNDIAYTSFESDGKGNWEFTGVATQDATSPTGNKCYNLSGGTLSKPGLTGTTSYKVSYYTKNSSAFTIAGTQASYPVKGATINGWTYYEHRVTAQTTISLSGAGFIDEVRLCPATAQMTTFTHQPLVGITTRADVNSIPAYYEYDGFGRLYLVRDENRNILKRICYNYAGQAEDCVPGQ